MKQSIWMIVVIGWVASSGSAAMIDFQRDQMKLHHDYIQIAIMYHGPNYDFPVCAEDKAENKRKEYLDRLLELRGQESALEMQTYELNQENLGMKSQMEQNKLELKQVKMDRKDVRRTIKELERGKIQFDKKDKLRKKTDKSQFGN